MPDRETIGRNLRDARENCRITQQAAAQHLGLSRTLIAQIELGNRPVSADELAKLAELYRQPVVDLVGADAPGHDELLLVLFDLAPELLADSAKRRVTDALTLCRKLTALERTVGRAPRVGLPRYDLPVPRTPAEAAAQGEYVAEQERQRLDLGSGPLQDVPGLIWSQGVRQTSVDLPDGIAGVFLQHETVGTAIWINVQRAGSECGHAFAHEYAHALLDRDRSVVVSKRGNAGQLIEKRANAFALTFLLPERGVRTALSSLGKGQPSRRTRVAFDPFTAEGLRVESRSTPGSQTITYQDIVAIARWGGSTYAAVLARLVTLGLVSDAEEGVLLSKKSRAAAEVLTAMFEPETRRRSADAASAGLDLRSEIVRLAVEGYRRGSLDKAALASVAASPQLRPLAPAKLLALAEAAR